MPLTVRQLFDSPEFAGMELICGSSGLDREITSVNVMEAPDIAKWLNGGELLLSTGYQFRDRPEELCDLVISIKNAGAAAMGFKNRFLKHFPPHARDLAEWLDLPIISLPTELPYSEIIRAVIVKTYEAENIRLSEAILRSFSQIIAEGGDTIKILQNLMFFAKCKVCFLDAVTGRRSCVPGTEDFEGVPVDNIASLLKKHPYERLLLAGSTYGYFIFDKYPEGSLGQVVIEHAKMAMLLATQRETATRQIESRYRDEFVQDLLTGNVKHHDEVLNRATRFGWNLSRPLRSVVVSIDGYREHFEHPSSENETRTLEEARLRIFCICVGEMRRTFGDCPYSRMSDSIVFLLNVDQRGSFKRKIALCANRVREKLSSWTDFTVTIGIGEEKPDFLRIAESYEDARRSIELMRPLVGGDNLYFWEELGVFTVLSPLCGTDEAHKFCRSRLGALLEDSERSRELLSTLEALIATNWNFQVAADTLRIHYNTVRYRYEKFSELLGMDFTGSNARLEVALALKLRQLDPCMIS